MLTKNNSSFKLDSTILSENKFLEITKVTKVLFLVFLWVFSACTNTAYQGRDILDAEEFILDSYQVLEGKAEIDRLHSIRGIDLKRKITFRPGLCLLEVLSKAKVSEQVNLSKSYLIRDNRLLPIHLDNLAEIQSFILEKNDKIYIMQDACIMVLGEVAREISIDSINEAISLKQALTYAGGILQSGDRSCIQVFRGHILQPKVYTVHEKHILELSKHSMLLVPGDIVHVAAKSFTGWGFIVNQQLPNFIAFDLLKDRCSLEITIQ